MLCCVVYALWRHRRRPEGYRDESFDESHKQRDDRPTEPGTKPELYTIQGTEDSQVQDAPKRRSIYSWTRFKKKVLNRSRGKNRGDRISTDRSLEDEQFGKSSDRSCAEFLPAFQTTGTVEYPPQTYANPWDFEYKPNPVIFAHLQPRNDEEVRPQYGQFNSEPGPTMGSTEMDVDIISRKSTPGRELANEPIVCDDCGATFNTPGQRNTHIARKHIRRFVCSLPECAASFHLNADLQRHRRTVHRDQLDSDSDHAEQWKCTNDYCKTPNLVFTRRDNFQRHLSRCRRSQS